MTRPVITMSAPAAQRLGDPEAAQVGVGRDRLHAPVLERRGVSRFSSARPSAWNSSSRATRLSPSTCATGSASPASHQVAHRRGQPGRVEPAGVGDHLDPALGEHREVRCQLAEEGGRVPAPLGVLPVRGGHPGERHLGQVVAHEDVDRIPGQRLLDGGEPVTEVAGEVADADRRRTSMTGR